MTKYHHFAKLSLQNAPFTHVRVPARALSLYILSLLPPMIFYIKKNKQNPFEYFCASRYAYIAAKIPL